MTPTEQSKVMEGFEANLRKLRKGAWLCYHLGDLAWDRQMQQTPNAIAEVVYAAYLKGRVCLTQRKLATNVYEYWAIGR